MRTPPAEWEWGVDNQRVYLFRDSAPDLMDRCYWLGGSIIRTQQNGSRWDWGGLIGGRDILLHGIPGPVARALIAFVDAKIKIERHEDYW